MGEKGWQHTRAKSEESRVTVVDGQARIGGILNFIMSIPIEDPATDDRKVIGEGVERTDN